jgi:hypothetical protein
MGDFVEILAEQRFQQDIPHHLRRQANLLNGFGGRGSHYGSGLHVDGLNPARGCFAKA